MVNQITYKYGEWEHTLLFPDHMMMIIPAQNPNSPRDSQAKRDKTPRRFLNYQNKNLNRNYR